MSKPPSKNSPSVKQNKRLRVFAGPNGSGKSTIIQALRNIKVNGRPIDFGIYINADDIATPSGKTHLPLNVMNWKDHPFNLHRLCPGIRINKQKLS